MKHIGLNCVVILVLLVSLVQISSAFIPPTPTNLANTTGMGWANHTWYSGGAGLVAFWDFNSSGVNITDVSGNGYNATYYGTAGTSWNTTCRTGGCFDYTNISEPTAHSYTRVQHTNYYTPNSLDFVNGTDLSVFGWFRYNRTISNIGSYWETYAIFKPQNTFVLGWSGWSHDGWEVNLWNQSNSNNSQKIALWYTQPLTADQWVHVGFTLNSTVLALYYNGEVVATNTTFSSLIPNFSVQNNTADTGKQYYDFFIGTKNQDPTENLTWDGSIDEVGVWNTALTPEEIRGMYAHSGYYGGNVTDSYNVSVNGTWTNLTTTAWKNTTGMDSLGWANIKVYAINSTTGYTQSLTPVTMDTQADAKFIPPTPASLANTTGNFWVNHTWSAGSGNVTDSYQILINGTWVNDTATTWYNSSGMSPHGNTNITVYAYNSTGAAVSETGTSKTTQIPNNAVTAITNTTNINIDTDKTVQIDFGCTDLDLDTCTYSIDRTDLFTNFNTNTGAGTWNTHVYDAGTYTILLGASDGFGSIINSTMVITIKGLQGGGTGGGGYSGDGDRHTPSQTPTPIETINVASKQISNNEPEKKSISRSLNPVRDFIFSIINTVKQLDVKTTYEKRIGLLIVVAGIVVMLIFLIILKKEKDNKIYKLHPRETGRKPQ